MKDFMKDLRVICLVGMIMFILNVTNLFAQAPDTLWTKTYGGVSDDEGFSTCQTADGGFIIARPMVARVMNLAMTFNKHLIMDTSLLVEQIHSVQVGKFIL
jgi:hypothetical protein